MIITTMLGIVCVATLSFFCHTSFMQHFLHTIMLTIIPHFDIGNIIHTFSNFITFFKYNSLGKLNNTLYVISISFLQKDISHLL